MSTMPDHLRPITIEIPVTWTAEQALAVWEMLDQLREKIWVRYGCQLQDLLAEEQRCAGVDLAGRRVRPARLEAQPPLHRPGRRRHVAPRVISG